MDPQPSLRHGAQKRYQAEQGALGTIRIGLDAWTQWLPLLG
jgi:hypothetical protein